MVSHIVEKRRSVIYTVATVLIIVAVFGALKLETTGCVVDDISKKISCIRIWCFSRIISMASCLMK